MKVWDEKTVQSFKEISEFRNRRIIADFIQHEVRDSLEVFLNKPANKDEIKAVVKAKLESALQFLRDRKVIDDQIKFEVQQDPDCETAVTFVPANDFTRNWLNRC